jgi:hypothetical protein
VRKRAAALLAVVVSTGCGGAHKQSIGPAESSCTGVPPAIARHGPVAIPRPISPEGPAGSWVAEYWSAEETMAEGGLCVVSESKPRTFALTGVVIQDDRPVRGAHVMFAPVHAAEGTTLQTRTDQNGGFAFVDVPVRGARACYRETITAGGEVWMDVDWASAGAYVQSIDLDVPRAPTESFCGESS